MDRSARVALRGDGSVVAAVALGASRNVGGQSLRRFDAYKAVYFDAAGVQTFARPSPSSITPTFSPAPSYSGNFLVTTVMRCDKQYYAFLYDERGNEKLRFALGAFNAIKDIVTVPSGHTYALVVSQSGRSGEVTLDEAGISIVKNFYDASFEDLLIAFDPQGKELWRRNATTDDGIGGAFGLTFVPSQDALFLIAARDRRRSPSGESDTVVARYEIGVGRAEGQFLLNKDVNWVGLRLGADNALVAFGDRQFDPQQPASRDLVVARVGVATGAVTEVTFGSDAADYAFDASSDASGAIYVVGSRGKLSDFGGDDDLAVGFVAKYAGGAIAWNQAFADPAAGMTLTSLDVAADGTLVTGGVINAAFAGGPFEGGRDAVFYKLDAAGTIVSASTGCDCGD